MEVSNLKEISKEVLKAVDSASEEVMQIYESGNFDIEGKQDGSPVTLADKKSHQALSSSLMSIDPNIPILSEEGDVLENTKSLFWLIDPLDGTKEFINKNGDFTINVALIEDGVPVLGVVSAPAIKECFVGFINQAFKIVNGKEIQINAKKQTQDKCLVTVSKSHKSDKDNLFIEACMSEFDKVEEVPTGSSLKLCRVAEGAANIYSRMGPTYQWDIAAGQAVVEGAGGSVSDLEGRPLRYEFKSEKKNPLFYCSGDPSFPWKNIFDKLV